MARGDPGRERLTMAGAQPEYLGRYRVLHLLGRGAVAEVYEVEDPKLFNARRALKLLRDLSPQAVDRLRSEARRLAELSHPNLIAIHDFGRDEASGRLFYTMDLLKGGSLHSVRLPWQVDDEAAVRPALVLTPSQVCRCFDGVLGALEHLHDAGVVHRDVKPENVALSADGVPRLLELGIAVVADEEFLLPDGSPAGTIRFMAPELVTGHAPTAASDLFALGLSLFEVFAGRSIYDVIPGEDLTTSQAIVDYLAGRVESGGEFEIPPARGLPESVRAVIQGACRLEPGARFKSAQEMRTALRAAAPAPRQQRSWHLAAVLSGDVVDYTVRVGEGVASAARELSSSRTAVAAAVERTGGRLSDFTGDAFLAEFPSTRAAVECARAIQGLRESAEDGPASSLRFRMGIDVGELLLDDDRLYGDAVNRAARLHALAAPGAVCLSDLARQQLGDAGELQIEVEDLGLQDLKNIPKPVRVHQLRAAR